MKVKLILIIALIRLLVPFEIKGQEVFRVLFYNVENFFDIKDNPDKQDDDFTPEGIRHWTNKRYNLKLQQISKVILSASQWNPPAIVGLCEVENESVLRDLIQKTPLKNIMYEYRITDGDDVRGINVAVLYRRDMIKVIGQENIKVNTTKRHRPTRQILYLRAVTVSSDTLDIFTVHLPSKYSGEKETEGLRLYASRLIKERADSIISLRKNPSIIIMGDFNDTAQNISISEGLGAKQLPDSVGVSGNDDISVYYDLFYDGAGTHKYQGNWSQIDHIIINEGLLTGKGPINFIRGSNKIHTPDFLLKDDRTWRGKRAFRTYYGYKYEGGFSDHLPIFADFEYMP